jgi:hypothetical protein
MLEQRSDGQRMPPARHCREHSMVLDENAIEFSKGERVGFRHRPRKNAAPKSASDQFGQPTRIVAAVPNVPRQPADVHEAGESLLDAAAEAGDERLAVERFELEALVF